MKNKSQFYALIFYFEMYRCKITNYCEFEPDTAKAYSLIHNIPLERNLGDITKVKVNDVKQFDFLCGGSPCQDFSVSGKQKGAVWTCARCGFEYNPITINHKFRNKCPKCKSGNIEKTRSSLLIYYLNFVRKFKPKFGMYENVASLLNKNHRETFNKFIEELESYGYNVYYKVMNARYYGIPQNRERIFVVYIRKDLDNGKFKFPKEKKLKLFICDLADKKKDYVIGKVDTLEKWGKIPRKRINANVCVYKDYSTTFDTRQRIYHHYGTLSCITRSLENRYCDDKYYYNLSIETAFKFFGFSGRDYDKIKNASIKKSILRGLAGNSIVVNCPYYIFVELFKAMPYLFDDLKVCSLFSGIGAFEKALKLLYQRIKENNK